MLTSRERILGKLQAAGARAPTLDTVPVNRPLTCPTQVKVDADAG